jgi:imidazolonepropionase-like amidohydrolase
MRFEPRSVGFSGRRAFGMVSRTCITLAALALAACTSASSAGTGASIPVLANAPFAPDSGSIALHCATLIDGVSREPSRDQTVLIRGGRIVSVTNGSERPKDVPWLDLPGYTCLPGLIDMHTHVTEGPEDTADLRVYFKRTDAQAEKLGARNAAATLQAGFTTIRNVGVYIAWTDRTLRDAINRGEVAGPRMQIVGYYLTIPGGGGDLLIPGVAEADIPARVRQGVSRGPEEFARNAQRAIDGGADLLKVIASGAVLAPGGVPGSPEMTPEELSAVVKVAHAAGRKVAAHAHGAESIRQAILAGADTIEHASLLDDVGIELALRYHVALSMDVYNGDYIETEGRRMKWPDEFLRNNLDTTEAQRLAFTRAHAAGVTIVFGTDAGVYPHGLNARQFPIMVARGMTPMEAIQSATSIAARYMGWSDRVGALKPGLMGDLIAVPGNPLDDVSLLQHVAVVVKGGLLFKAPTASK